VVAKVLLGGALSDFMGLLGGSEWF